MSQDPDDKKAVDILPAGEPQPPPEETRKIGYRRVPGFQTVDRIWTRRDRRPVGNSRRLWRKIECDDPFKDRPIKAADFRQEIYVAERLGRIRATTVSQPTSAPPPKPQAPRPTPRQEAKPPPRTEAPRPQPRREATPPPRPTPPPEPVHTRDTRTVPPMRKPEPEATPAPPIDRTPPRIVPQGKSKSGRIRTARKAVPTPGPTAKSAAEIREEKLRWREAAKEGTTPEQLDTGPKKTLDTYAEFVRNMEFMEKLHEQGLDIPDMNADQVDAKPRPRPKPKAVAEPAPTPPPASKAVPAPAPKPKPAPPPKPKPTAPPASSTSKKPAAKSSSGGMDDLFGAPTEGRVRIGKRAKKSSDTSKD